MTRDARRSQQPGELGDWNDVLARRGWPAVVECLWLGRSEGDAMSEAVLPGPGHEREVVADARRLLRLHGPTHNYICTPYTRSFGPRRASTAGVEAPTVDGQEDAAFRLARSGTRRSSK